MSTVQELEEQLREAKLKESWERLQKKLTVLQQEYLNKAFGNKRLTYNCLNRYFKKDTHIEVCYIDDIYVGTSSYSGTKYDRFDTFDEFKRDSSSACIVATGQSMYITKYGDRTSINIGDMRQTEFNGMDTYMRKEISNDTYNKLLRLISDSVDNIFVTNVKGLPVYSAPDEDRVKVLREKGCRLIELTSEEEYTVNGHPFKYGNYLLDTGVSKVITMDIYKQAEEDNRRDVGFWYGGEYARPTGVYAKKVEHLRNILNKYTVE